MSVIAGNEIATEMQPRSRNRLARTAGSLYLAYVAVFVFSSFVQGKPLVWGDAAATAKNILQSVTMFRIGFMTEIVAALLFLWTAWALQALFRPVNRDLAMLLVLFNLAGVASECTYTLIHFGALQCLVGTDVLHGLNADQVQAMAMVLLRIGGAGSMVATLFFGAWLFPLGWLVYKSRYIPRFWGVLLIADGVCLMICFVQLCLFPAYQKWTYPLYPIMFVAEVGTALWLVIKGVNQKPAGLTAGQAED